MGKNCFWVWGSEKGKNCFWVWESEKITYYNGLWPFKSQPFLTKYSLDVSFFLLRRNLN